jgi:hypothetical protein
VIKNMSSKSRMSKKRVVEWQGQKTFVRYWCFFRAC